MSVYSAVHDADGDIVQCRWAESRNRECGCVCNGFTTAVLNKVGVDMHVTYRRVLKAAVDCCRI